MWRREGGWGGTGGSGDVDVVDDGVVAVVQVDAAPPPLRSVNTALASQLRMRGSLRAVLICKLHCRYAFVRTSLRSMAHAMYSDAI